MIATTVAEARGELKSARQHLGQIGRGTGVKEETKRARGTKQENRYRGIVKAKDGRHEEAALILIAARTYRSQVSTC